MIRIGVLSDTHSRELPAKMITDLKKVDIIVHAGDFETKDFYDFLSSIKEVKAVSGNMDDSQVKKFLPDQLIFKAEEVFIGVYHGTGPSKTTIDFVKERFKGKKLDVVIFGHTHLPFNKTIDGILYFNPGSPNDVIFSPYCSYGILEIDKDKVNAKIVKI